VSPEIADLALKNLFGGKKVESEAQLTIDDLIALERFGEAEEKLRHRLNIDGRDLHHRLKLADLLMRIGERVQAVDEYLLVAEGYARDGFYDKASALLSKIGRYLPDNEKIRTKIAALDRAKRQERRRAVVVEGLLNAQTEGAGKTGRSAVELQQLWSNLTESPMVDRLSDVQLRRFFGAVRVLYLPSGAKLVEAGSQREEIYLVGKGEIEAVGQGSHGKLSVVRSFGPGQLIGDRSLLEHKPWPAVYRTSRASVVMALDKGGLEHVLTGESDPKGLLDHLREQRNDKDVYDLCRRLANSL
jgi:tetratricopeptide (TPR) repeat protein